ncbi:ester cyclase [Ralstonia pseudosolanacearum]|uniref:ester cyclase n=1 Tax=Ralstonia pseudosolanacearum TaxID=1310165 RepID=UPI002E23CEA5
MTSECARWAWQRVGNAPARPAEEGASVLRVSAIYPVREPRPSRPGNLFATGSPHALTFRTDRYRTFPAFPGFSFQIERMVAEGDQVAAYLVFDGEHKSGVIDGIAPAGKRLRFSLLMLLTISDGKIIEKRAHFDRMDIHRQLSGEP